MKIISQAQEGKAGEETEREREREREREGDVGSLCFHSRKSTVGDMRLFEFGRLQFRSLKSADNAKLVCRPSKLLVSAFLAP